MSYAIQKKAPNGRWRTLFNEPDTGEARGAIKFLIGRYTEEGNTTAVVADDGLSFRVNSRPDGGDLIEYRAEFLGER